MLIAVMIGIPPHVLLLEGMSQVRDEFKCSVKDILSKVEEKRDGLSRGVVREVFKGKITGIIVDYVAYK